MLDGGTGTDTMSGGAGNDTYVVDAPATSVTELAGEGTDTVQSSVTYTLGANVENLTLTGTAAINGTGNTLDNVAHRQRRQQRPRRRRRHRHHGRRRRQRHLRRRRRRRRRHRSCRQGTDTVQSSISYTLGANVENLTLTGTATINGTGNALDNTLTGNAGNNVLDGGAGTDTMTGGAGNDTYVVDAAGDVVTEAGQRGHRHGPEPASATRSAPMSRT